MERLKIALFNVTNLVDKNPGCNATINGLKLVLKNFEITEFPLGFGYDFFQKSSGSLGFKCNFFSRHYKKFTKNIEIIDIIDSHDYLVINAEGTIHSNSIGAMTLLAFAKFGIENKKKVFVLNGSYYNLDKKYLNILKQVNFLSTRELLSHQYLSFNNISSELIPDCAYLTKFNSSLIKNENCLYTPGVKFTYGVEYSDKQIEKFICKHFDAISEKYKFPTFLIIDEKEKNLGNIWLKRGGRVLDGTNIDLGILLEEIGKYDLVISGRYHILLFALMCKVKTIPISSNSHKIKGLYDSLIKNDYKIQSCYTENLNINNVIEIAIDVNEIKKTIIEKYSILNSL